MAASRRATVFSAAAAGAVAAGYLALTWDAWLTNFQVRWMCDEDRPFVLERHARVAALAISADIARRDAQALPAFGPHYPEVLVAAGQGLAARHQLVERWPSVIRDYWGFRVVRTDFSVIDRADRGRVLGNASLFRREERGPEAWRRFRRPVVPPAQACLPSDRVEFVKDVLRAE